MEYQSLGNPTSKGSGPIPENRQIRATRISGYVTKKWLFHCPLSCNYQMNTLKKTFTIEKHFMTTITHRNTYDADSQ